MRFTFLVSIYSL